MITLEQLIANELKLALEHEPTAEELNAVSEFLAPRKFKYMIEVDNAIHDWAKINTVECQWCGEKHLPSEMIDTEVGFFCDCTCIDDWETEHGSTGREADVGD